MYGRVGVQLVAGGVADEDGGAPDGRRGEALGAAQPLAAPPGGEGPGGALVAVALADLVERGEQDVLHRALDRAQRERRLHGGVGAVGLEGGEGPGEGPGVRAQALLGDADGRGDREPVVQGVAQGGHLAVGVEAVAARGTGGLGEAEAPLPRAQRVRADVEKRRCLTRLERAHACTAPRRKTVQLLQCEFARPLQQNPCKSRTRPLRWFAAESSRRVRKEVAACGI